MFSSPMKHAIDAGPLRLVDEARDAMALGVDLDEQGDLDALVLLELDDPVEELLPMAVAGHVVVGDEERRDALLVVLADDRFEVVDVAEPALAALHVDDGAERALERAAAAEIEARLLALVARQRGRRQMRRRRALDARQVVHVVVEALQRAVPGIAQHLVEPAFLGLAGIDRDAHVHGFLDLRRHDRQHRQAAGGMEAAHRHRQAGRQELAGEIDGVRELVGLDAHQADQALAAAALEIGDDPVGADPDIGLVERLDDDIDVRPKNLTLPAILTQPIEGGQGVGRDVRLQPGDRIAIVVVMSRLDQNELESLLLVCTAHCGLSPTQSAHGFVHFDQLTPIAPHPAPHDTSAQVSYHGSGKRNFLCGAFGAMNIHLLGVVNCFRTSSPYLAPMPA